MYAFEILLTVHNIHQPTKCHIKYTTFNQMCCILLNTEHVFSLNVLMWRPVNEGMGMTYGSIPIYTLYNSLSWVCCIARVINEYQIE